MVPLSFTYPMALESTVWARGTRPRPLAKRIFDRSDAGVRRQQLLDIDTRQEQRLPHSLRRSGWPIAFHPKCPLFMYFASKPASRNLIAVLQPTWKPYEQYTMTGSDFDSSPIHSWSFSGSRH